MKGKIFRKTVTYLMTLALGLFYAALPLLPVGLTAYAEEGTEEDDELIPTDAKHFPDVSFRSFISRYDKDHNSSLSKEEREAVTEIDFNKAQWQGISNLHGVEYFPNLETLMCNGQELTSLDVSSLSNLQKLECYRNKLTKLNIGRKTNLTWLNCSENKLTELDISNCPNLQIFSCGGNQLTQLDISGNLNLLSVGCDRNQLTEIDVSKQENLHYLNCGINQFTELDISQNEKLGALACDSNQLTELDLTHNPKMERLDCGENQLTELDVTENSELRMFLCDGNQLTELDVTNNPELTELQCQNNQLGSLDLSGNAELTKLVCEDNQLTELDVSHNSKLSSIKCSRNQLTSLDLNQNPDSTLQWKDVQCEGNSYIIGDDITQFDLSSLPRNFDENKASQWTGAECIDGVLTNFSNTGKITYQYACRNTDECVEFQLVYYAKKPDPVHKHQFTNYICECGAVEIREETFPDQKFRTYVLNSYDWDEDGILSESEKAIGTKISVSNNGIEDLTGIEYFTYATSLNCSGNQLTSLDISKNTALTSVVCNNNRYNIGKVSSFDLKDLPGKFDAAKASSWQGAKYANGKLTNFSGDGTITYLYEIGNGSTVTFTLTYTPTEPSPVHEHKFNNHVCACGAVEVDETIFPDAVFRKYILDTYDKDKDTIFSKEEIEAATTLQIAQKGIRSLTGIEYFTSATSLDCSSNQLTSLDISKNTALTSVVCDGNRYSIGEVTSFDLENLPGSFDTTKASNWKGAKYADGKLTDFSGDGIITYLYEIGNGSTATFTLTYVEAGHEHKFIRQADEWHLKTPATCTEAAVYYYSCELCGESSTGTFSDGQPKGHTWDAGVVTAAASRTTIGYKRHTCEACGAVTTEVLEKTAGVTNIEILVGEKVFQGKLYDNEAAEAFKAKLPLTLQMKDVSGLEKYCNLTENLPTAASVPTTIQAGDILLLESSGLNLFYQDVQLSESYTPLGYAEDSVGYAKALGTGDVTVTIRLKGTSNPNDPDDPNDPDITKRYWGDVDGKDGVTPDDALMVLMDLAGKQSITDKVGKILADCDGAPGISPDDALYILQTVAGKRNLRIYDGPPMNVRRL